MASEAEATDHHSNDYFGSYEDIEIHRLMVKDKSRTEAYKDAISKNEHLFRGKIVLDVGAGTGILSLFIAKAGAKKVYAIEASALAKSIPSIAKENGFSDIIEVFHTPVEDFTLPTDEKADVLVSEWMGFYLLHESMLSSVIYARDNFLNEVGTMFPSEVMLYVCPCSLENFYEEQFYFWENVYGFNMSAIEKCAFQGKQTKPEICQISPTELLAEPVCIKTFNMLYVTECEITAFSCTSFVGISKAGTFQALGLWFACDFDGRTYCEDGEEEGTLVTLSTSPHAPVTHWKQTAIIFGVLRKNSYQMLKKGDKDAACSSPKMARMELASEEEATEGGYNDQGHSVEEDEVVGWKLDFYRDEEKKRNYSITMEMLDPEEVEHPIPCVCPTPRCLIIAKMIENEDEELMNQSLSEGD